MKSFFAFVFFLFIFSTGFFPNEKESKYTLDFLPVFNRQVIYPGNKYYLLNANDSVQLETLKFYISGIDFLNKSRSVWKEKNSFHLLDFSDEALRTILMDIPSSLKFDELKFNLGIDSLTNVSGAMGGDLDPTKGMYWTWQNGYINFKIEGKCNLCKTRNTEFQFHLGGYQSPFNSLQTLVFKTGKRDSEAIVIDLVRFFDQIDLSSQNQIMTPGKEAVFISGKVSRMFSVTQK